MVRSLLNVLITYSLLHSGGHLLAFEDQLNYDNNRLNKSGESEVKALGFIKLFEAALYLEDGHQTYDFPGDFSYALSIRYNLKIRSETLIKTSQDILGDLYDSAKLSAIEAKLDKINQYYTDVEKGDIYSLIYKPDSGTTLLYNGKPKVTIEGKTFAEIYFSIWLGGHPKCKQLEKDLLAS